MIFRGVGGPSCVNSCDDGANHAGEWNDLTLRITMVMKRKRFGIGVFIYAIEAISPSIITKDIQVETDSVAPMP